jgi:tRNA threonylcarbamoyladenosine biosynthesis protein TsaB
MSKILCIDTSVYACSVALCVDGEVVSYISEKDKNKSAEILNSFIEEVCKDSQISLKEIDAIGIVSGPGSYTGIRIASSTAKGLCYGLNIPLISVSTFEAMRESVNEHFKEEKFEQYIFAIDARREDVFATIQDENGENIIEPGPFNLSEKSIFFDAINPSKKTIITGNGAEKTVKYLNYLQNLIVCKNLDFGAKNISASSLNSFITNNFKNIAYFTPNYIKPAFLTEPKKS